MSGPLTTSGLRPEQIEAALAALKAAGRRRAFNRLADRAARRFPPLALSWWLPGLTRGERARVAAAEPELRLRPCFDREGAALHLCSPEGAERFLRLSRATRRALSALSFSAGLGRDLVAACLLAGDLDNIADLRLEANSLKPREALVWRGDENLIHVRVDGDDRLFEALSELPALTSLRLRSNRLGSAGAIALAARIGLTRLDLRGNRIGSEGAAALAALPALTYLDLSFNEVRPEGAAALAGAPALAHLDLSGNPIGGVGAAALGALVPLRTLGLAAANLGPDAPSALAGLAALTRLDLGRNPLGDHALAPLAELTALRSLSLDRVGVSDAGARALSGLTRLTHLELSGNPLGDDGAAALGGLTALTALALDRCGVGPRGARELPAAALSVLRLAAGAADPRLGPGDLAGLLNPGLRVLDLSGHALGDDGAARVARGARLERLYLSGADIGDPGAAALAALPALRVLHLDGGRIGPSGAAALSHLPAVEHLVLDGNPIGDAGAAALADLGSPGSPGSPSLVRVHLRDAGVTDEVLDALRAALPDADVLPR